MQPARRLQILATVGHENQLPYGTKANEVEELKSLIRPLGYPRYQLTAAGWRAIEMAGQQVMGRSA